MFTRSSLITLKVYSDITRNNISTGVFFNQELVFVNPDMPAYYDYTFVYFKSADDSVITMGLIDIIDNSGNISFIIQTKNIWDIQYILNFRYVLTAWNIETWKFLFIRFMNFPYNIQFYIEYGLHRLEYRIIIGDYLYCNSTAKPWYRYIDFIDITNLNSPLQPGNISVIPMHNRVNFGAIIICQITLFEKRKLKRNTNKISRYVTVRLFQYFEFDPMDNILLSPGILKCVTKVIENYKLFAVQLSGASDLNMINDIINLTSNKGGLYVVGCVLIVNSTVYSIYESISMRTYPTDSCFMLHTEIVGSIIQCSHNGYIRDEYIIQLALLTTHDQLFYEIEYFRIPYYINVKIIRVVCYIEDIFTEKPYNLSILLLININFDVSKAYPFTNEEKECAEHTKYIEDLPVKEYNAKKIVIEHYIFFSKLDIEMIKSEVFFIIFLIISFIFIINLSNIIYISGNLKWKIYINKIAKSIRSRALQEKSIIEARVCISLFGTEKKLERDIEESVDVFNPNH